MSSDEDNYMSDKFLSECVKQDIRPGLIKSRSCQREIEVARKKRRVDAEYRKSTKPDEKERLESGLKSAISSENKGFALLAKMGYKEGETLGKSSSGITEPLSITFKRDKTGLGHEKAIQELKEQKKEIQRKRLLEKVGGTQISVEEYRKQWAEKAEKRCMENSLKKCQSICEILDTIEDIEEPQLLWFWPDNVQSNEDNESASCSTQSPKEDVEYELTTKLSMLTKYLRESYYYCHWCQVYYNDIDDLKLNCPGPEKGDH